MKKHRVLRALIRTIIMEQDDKEVMGEPDLSSEEEREASDEQLEFSAISGMAVAGAPVQPFVIDKKKAKKAKK